MGRLDSDTEKIAYDIVEMLGTVEEAAEYLSEKEDLEQFEFISMYADIQDSITMIRKLAGQMFSQYSDIRLGDACDCILFSLEGILQLAVVSMKQAQEKIGYELIPMLDTACIQFFYYAITKENASKKQEFHHLLKQKTMNRFVDQAVKTREYKYDLSIAILAYNHLDYTRMCVESILENIPQGIRYELILINHGSTDDTQEYFESIPNAKIIHILINGIFPCLPVRICKGKYFLFVSNDIIMTHDSIYNLYRCIVEHDDYGWVVPTTPNVSNLQTISAQYANEDELVKFAVQNNIYDERRHEQRVRLCNPVTAIRAETEVKMYEEMYEAIGCGNAWYFPDDKCSLWFRRNGYRLILAKDAYCHHFGSVTVGEEVAKEQAKNYSLGRIEMKKEFGIDPWGVGFCYDMSLVKILQYPKNLSNATVLGINCGLGSNPLKIKEMLRCEKDCNVVVYNFERDANVIPDLKGVSDQVYLYKNIAGIGKYAGGQHFTYIVLDQIKDEKEIKAYLNEFKKTDITFDFMYVKTSASEIKLHMNDTNYHMEYKKDWICITTDVG